MNKCRAVGGFLAAACLVAVSAVGQESGRRAAREEKANHPNRDNDYRVTILVSNEEEDAPVVDPLLVNAWGIAASPKSPWWVANNGTGTSTLYNGDGEKQKLEVKVPGAPTGMVFNGGSEFELGPKQPALFLFASEDGTISGWNPGANPNAVVVFSHTGSNYKGLAISGNVLYTTDFGDACRVATIGGGFQEFQTTGGFADRSIPDSYCPFGIQAVGDSIFVTYAKKNGEDDEAGIGHGFVRQFDLDGRLVARVGSHGLLDSPWGMAPAPGDFGRFSQCLLVGNFGNGQVNAFCQTRHGEWHHAGRLRDKHHHVIRIDGLWGIGFGNGQASGPTDVLYFAAGPDEESNGYFGKIEFAH